MAITAQYSGYISVVDNTTGAQALQKVLSSLATAGTTFQEAQSFAIGTSPVSITLPISPINFLYVKNLSLTNTITVTWTPNGGSSNTVVTLVAGAFIGFAEPSGSNGISALSLTASGASTPVEFIVAG
jgi:hypothetical protein